MELVVQKNTMQAIVFNYDDLKKELSDKLEAYKGLVYDDTAIATAKEDRAYLNKMKDAIEKKRKEVKADCLKPYDEFEKKVKELSSMVEAQSAEIDKQVKDYEQKQKEAKNLQIVQFYAEHIGSAAGLLPIEKIFNQKWLNTAYSMKNIKDEILTAIEKFNADMDSLKALETEYSVQIVDVYLKTLDLSAAMRENVRLTEQKKKLSEFAEKHSEEKDIQETVAAAEMAFSKPEQTQEPAEEINEAPDAAAWGYSEKPVEEVRTVDFRIHATKSQLAALKAFLIQNHIEYGRVE